MGLDNQEGPADDIARAVKTVRTQMQAEIDRVSGELGRAQQTAAKAEAAAKELSELRQRYDTERASWDVERTMARHELVDPDGQEIARLLYGRMPEQGRPALDAWIAQHRAAPEQAPAGLRPYLRPMGGGNVAAPPAGQPAPPSPPAAGARAAERPGGATPPPSGPVTVEGLRAARQKAMRTGDWAAFNALRAAHAQETGGGG